MSAELGRICARLDIIERKLGVNGHEDAQTRMTRELSAAESERDDALEGLASWRRVAERCRNECAQWEVRARGAEAAQAQRWTEDRPTAGAYGWLRRGPACPPLAFVWISDTAETACVVNTMTSYVLADLYRNNPEMQWFPVKAFSMRGP